MVLFGQTKLEKYTISTVCYTIVSDESFAWIISLVVQGLSWSEVVEGNLLIVSASILSTPDMWCMLGPNS